MLNKVFEYAGSHKKSIHLASFIMLISVIMGVLPFLFAYQIINPLILGEQLEFERFAILLISILVCLVLQAVLGGLGLNVSHTTRCLDFEHPYRKKWKIFHWVLLKKKGLVQSKKCLWMILAV